MQGSDNSKLTDESVRIGDPLPRADEAVVDDRKLTEYALNPGHPTGRHKARLFAAVLGIEVRDSEYLRRQILGDLPASPVVSIRPGGHAPTYEVLLDVRGRNGRMAQVLTAWALDDGVPRLVSVRVDRRGLRE